MANAVEHKAVTRLRRGVVFIMLVANTDGMILAFTLGQLLWASIPPQQPTTNLSSNYNAIVD